MSFLIIEFNKINDIIRKIFVEMRNNNEWNLRSSKL
jgi:hypothetical protein